METTKALRRVRLITPMMREDVGTAVLSNVVMQAANNTIPKGLKGTYTPFSSIYSAGQNALALKLAMDLARIFDLSENRKPEAQDKASIPVLAALLKRPDVQEGLIEDAEEWLSDSGHIYTAGSDPSADLETALERLKEHHRSQFREGCRTAITDFLDLALRLEEQGSKEQSALGRIRQFRNRRLAHSLIDKKPDALPKYADLDLLLEVAKEAAKHASLAVDGHNSDFDDLAQEDRRTADRYYACVLDGLKREARGE
jgi:hypothetical protein